MSAGRIMRTILLVSNIPTPYRLPLFEALSNRLRERGYGLTVVFSARSYSRRQWHVDLAEANFDYRVLDSSGRQLGSTSEQTMFFYKGLMKTIKRERPKVLIVSGFSVATLYAWLLSWIGGPRYLIWSGSLEGRFDSPWRTWLRKRLAQRAYGGIAYGSLAKSYLEHLGISEDRLHVAINTVDTRFFARSVTQERQQNKVANTPKRLTYIGYLSARKCVRKMLDVVHELAKERDDFVLDIVGDGEERAALEMYVQNRGLTGHVIFHGYRQRAELPAYLARSSCFLFQTDFDIWGLVLVEAMTAGLPVVASVNAGATHDLIREGDTGLAVDFADTGYVADKINWLLNHPEEANAMGERASAFIADHVTIEKSAEGFVEAILDVLGPKAPFQKPLLSAEPGAAAIR